jgi:hypothetical protein
VSLRLRNLRNPTLTSFVLKDGDAGAGSTKPLPPPATYQGKVRGGGTAVFTITPDLVEGTMLMAPGGWAFIEPLEPLLRLRNVDPAEREQLLRKYNHVVYNSTDFIGDTVPSDDPGGPTEPVSSTAPPVPLIMSIVADGDAALFRSYPLDSMMPFWLKQETILNAVDWLYNCVEPEGNAHNAYANCGNDFDGGSGAFQARLRVDRLETWTSGGPSSNSREGVLEQSMRMTHQSEPVCCGEPHTAGHADVVHLFSGGAFDDGAGVAKGNGGVSYYGPLCWVTNYMSKCHHAISQIVPNVIEPNFTFYGNAFEQQALVAHEIGHVAGAPELTRDSTVCWLFGKTCRQSLMSSGSGFKHSNLFLYDPNDTHRNMGPLLAEHLERASDVP